MRPSGGPSDPTLGGGISFVFGQGPSYETKVRQFHSDLLEAMDIMEGQLLPVPSLQEQLERLRQQRQAAAAGPQLETQPQPPATTPEAAAQQQQQQQQ